MNYHTTTSQILIDAPVVRVWEALTRPELVKQWQYGADVITDWQKGSSIIYRSEWESNVFEQRGTILDIEPERLVKYTLFAPRPGLEEKPENSFIMTYRVEETDGKTMLTIIQDDPREQQPQEQADEAENTVLDSLKRLVEG
jgi:uncharacterized protein YndB with AHSA1/START domain